MTTTDKADSGDTTTIVDRYVALATRHGEATESGNSDDANAAYRELTDLFAQIIENGDREKLIPLLTHPNPAVRAKAAFHTHAMDSQRSESVLEEVANSSGLVGFSAGMTLKQLKSEGLTPP
jgi:hypothetical protein